jgi:hypothetical protein
VEAIPELDARGLLPVGIHATSLTECLLRFGNGSARRRQAGLLLEAMVNAARHYPFIKRVLVWGSFASDKPEPNDLDYSLVVSVNFREAVIAPEHRRFLIPHDARLFYGVDRGYLVLPDYPIERYAEFLLFLCDTREQGQRGIIEIPLCREAT